MIKQKILSAFLTLVSLMVCGAANAEEMTPIGEDRLKIGLGGYFADFDTRVSAGLPDVDPPDFVDFENNLSISSKQESARIDAYFRFAERHRLYVTRYSFKRSGSAEVTEEIEFEDLVIPAGTSVSSTVKWTLTPISYGYSFWKKENLEIAASIGVHWAEISADIDAQLNEGRQKRGASASGPLPTIGLHLDWSPARNWLVGGDIRFFGLDYDIYSGNIWDARLYAERYFWKNFGVGLGINVFDFDVAIDGDDFHGKADFGYGGWTGYLTYRY